MTQEERLLGIVQTANEGSSQLLTAIERLILLDWERGQELLQDAIDKIMTAREKLLTPRYYLRDLLSLELGSAGNDAKGYVLWEGPRCKRMIREDVIDSDKEIRHGDREAEARKFRAWA